MMEEQCPKCGAFVSEEDFNDEAESQHCPQCHCELPCELAERLRAEFERKTVVCWRCGCRTWAKDVNFDLLGLCLSVLRRAIPCGTPGEA
ncbi:MAG: transposase [Victivallales bacterium]|nr:transposase [Victivallales bacterium]